MADLTDDELLAELGVAVEPPRARTYSPREERIIAGFEDIVRFYGEHGRAPLHGEERDIFERLYAVRLERLRALVECRSLLAPLDHQGLLAGADTLTGHAAAWSFERKLAELWAVDVRAASQQYSLDSAPLVNTLRPLMT